MDTLPSIAELARLDDVRQSEAQRLQHAQTKAFGIIHHNLPEFSQQISHHVRRWHEGEFLSRFFSSDPTKRPEELREPYAQLMRTQPAEVINIRDSLSEFTANHEQAQTNFLKAVREFEAAHKGMRADKEIARFRTSKAPITATASRKAPTVMELKALQDRLAAANAEMANVFKEVLQHPVIKDIIPTNYTTTIQQENFIRSLFLPGDLYYRANLGADELGEQRLRELRTKLATTPELADARTRLTTCHQAELAASTALHEANSLYSPQYHRMPPSGQQQTRAQTSQSAESGAARSSAAAEAPRPSVEHPTWRPEPPPQKPSFLQRVREGWRKRFGRGETAAQQLDRNLIGNLIEGERENAEFLKEVDRILPSAEQPLRSGGSAGKIALGLGIVALGGWAAYALTRDEKKKTPEYPNR